MLETQIEALTLSNEKLAESNAALTKTVAALIEKVAGFPPSDPQLPANDEPEEKEVKKTRPKKEEEPAKEEEQEETPKKVKKTKPSKEKKVKKTKPAEDTKATGDDTPDVDRAQLVKQLGRVKSVYAEDDSDSTGEGMKVAISSLTTVAKTYDFKTTGLSDFPAEYYAAAFNVCTQLIVEAQAEA